MSNTTKIGVIGGGAVGLTYASFLSEVTSVILNTRTKYQADVINDQGIELIMYDKSKVFKQLHATADTSQIKDCEVIIVAVKSYDTESVAKQLSEVLSQDEIVISMQNGLQAGPILRSIISNPKRVFAGVTYMTGKRFSDRGVNLGDKRRSVLDKRAEPLVTLLKQTKFDIESVDNIDQAVWDKMVLNTGQNALSAVTDMPVGDMINSSECMSIAKNILNEFKTVAEAEGITFTYNLMDALEANFKGTNFYPSMWQDLHNGNKTEIDAINGSISVLGKKHGISTPYNDMIISLVRIQEMKTDKSK